MNDDTQLVDQDTDIDPEDAQAAAAMEAETDAFLGELDKDLNDGLAAMNATVVDAENDLDNLEKDVLTYEEENKDAIDSLALEELASVSEEGPEEDGDEATA